MRAFLCPWSFTNSYELTQINGILGEWLLKIVLFVNYVHEHKYTNTYKSLII